MLRQFLSDSVFYGGANILSRSMLLLLLPVYTRVFAPGEYGTIELLTAVGALVNVTVALEISQGLARHFPDAQTDEQRQAYASTALWFSLGAYLIFGVGVLAFAEPLSAWLLGDASMVGVFRAAAVAMAVGGLFLSMQSQLRWQLKPRGYAVTSLVYTVVTAAATLLLILVAHLGLLGIFYGQVLGGLVGVAVAGYFGRDVYRRRFDTVRLKEMLRFSLPLVPSSLAVFATLYVDRLAIRALLSLAEVGLYGVGYRLASTVGVVLAGFQTALTPLIYRHHQAPETPAQLARIFRVFLGLTLPLVLALAVFASELLRLLATERYAGAEPVIAILGLVFLLSNLYVFAPGLAIAKKTGAIAAINAGTAVLNTLLTITLLPRFGILGACLASLATAAAAFACYMVTSQRLYPVPHRWGRIGLATLGMGGLYALKVRLEPGLDWDVLIVGAGAVWSMALLIGREELSRLVRRPTNS